MTLVLLLATCVVVGLGLGMLARLTPVEIAAKVTLMCGAAAVYWFLVVLLEGGPAH